MSRSSSPVRGRRLAGIIASLAIVAVFAATLLAPMAAEAAPRKFTCGLFEGCHEECQQQLPNGDTAYYPHGTRITMHDGKTGEEIEFECVDGQWQRVSALIKGHKVLGNIGVGSMGGIQGELTATVCNDSPEPVCTDVRHEVGPPGRRIADVCNPEQLVCP